MLDVVTDVEGDHVDRTVVAKICRLPIAIVQNNWRITCTSPAPLRRRSGR